MLGGLAAAVGLYLYSRTQSGGDAISGAVGSLVDSVSNLINGPRGIRNNNPGNVVRSNIRWQGSLPPDQVPQPPPAGLGIPFDSTFEQMDTPANGVRMIGHVLVSKAARGLTSVDQIIRDYSLTDQDAYVAHVAAALGVDPSEVIDVQSSLPTIAAAIIQQENGTQPYNPSDIAEWVYS